MAITNMVMAMADMDMVDTATGNNHSLSQDTSEQNPY